MSKDKHLEEKEKLDAEITRSLSVVKMKEAHKQIEDIEKLRKQAAIRSICKRIASYLEINNVLVSRLLNLKKEHHKQQLNWELTDDIRKYLNLIMERYESICFDLRRAIDIKKEDFDRLFPKVKFDFSTYESVILILNCLNMQLIDMQNYCSRLL